MMSRMSFTLDVVAMGASEAPVMWLLGEGRPKFPSPFDVMRNSLTVSSVMAHRGVDAMQWVEPMKAEPSLHLLGETLKPPN
jgi:hypothetical protein